MTRWGISLSVSVAVAFVALGWILPGWLVFLLTEALAKGLVVLSVVLLMRGGMVSFGQALFYAASAYTVGFAMRLWGLREVLILIGLGVGVALLVGALIGLLVARYRGIFFAMLTLAFSMILYGVLIRAYAITGGSDGLRIPPPTLLGAPLRSSEVGVAIYYVTLLCVGIVIYVIFRYLNAPLGHLMRAIRDNEVRVRYVGGSVWRAIYLTYVLAAGVGGLGGVLAAFNVGHIDPDLAYWTTSGEFVFITLLGGIEGVFAPLGGAIVYELVKSYAFKYAPNTWEMVLGAIMLGIILFLPEGLWTPVERRLRGIRA